jgi:hypothetical protein
MQIVLAAPTKQGVKEREQLEKVIAQIPAHVADRSRFDK